MYSLINFTVHLIIKITMLILMLSSIGNLMVAVSDATSSVNITNNNSTTITSTNNTSPESDNSYEFIKLNTTSSSSSSNDTDAKKSENLHLLTRIYQRLHEFHNRHHHHHLHHMRRGSGGGGGLFGDRPFRLFNRQVEREPEYDRQDSFEGGYHSARGGGGLAFDRPYQRRFRGGGGMGGQRPWSRRRRQIDDTLDNGLDDYLEHFNYKKNLKLSQHETTTLSPSSFLNLSSHSYELSSFNKSPSSSYTLSTFKPSPLLLLTFSHSLDRSNSYHHKQPFYSSNLRSPIISPTKSYISSTTTTTTPTSISLTTHRFDTNSHDKFEDTLDASHKHDSSNKYESSNKIDTSQNKYESFSKLDTFSDQNSFTPLTFNSTSHHYYHQAYLLYKYFKLYKDKNVNEIDWQLLPAEIKDKFKMLIVTLRYTKKQTSINDLTDEFVISKALEIVKWKGWEMQELKAKRKEESKRTDDFKPIVPTVNHKQNIDSFAKVRAAVREMPLDKSASNNEFTNHQLQNDGSRLIKQATSSDKKWSTSQVNSSIDQIDEIDTASNTYASNIDCDHSLSNSSPNTYVSNTDTSPSNTYSSLSTYPSSSDSSTENNLVTSSLMGQSTTTLSPNGLQKAFENNKDIMLNHSCKVPRGRLLSLKKMNREYRSLKPQWVYLHKCDDEAGCCDDEEKKHCVAMEQEVIVKYFYDIAQKKKDEKVIQLEFVNDTRCQCREVDHNSLMKAEKNDWLKQLKKPTGSMEKSYLTSQKHISNTHAYSAMIVGNGQQLKDHIDTVAYNRNRFDLNSFDKTNGYKTSRQHGIDFDAGQYSSYGQSVPSQSANEYNDQYDRQFIKYQNANQQPNLSPQIYRHQSQLNAAQYDPSLNAIQTHNQNLKKNDRSTHFWNKKFNGKLSVQHPFDCATDLICPEPFTITQDRNEQNLCYCGCKSKNVNCIKVMNGLKRLDNYQMNCVLQEQCLHPECLFKTSELDYNKQTGYCPTKEEAMGAG